MDQTKMMRPVPRGPGRPAGSTRAPESGTTLNAWIPASQHDHLVRLARERDVSVSSVVRQILILRLT